MTKRITDLQASLYEQMLGKASLDDVRSLTQEKADLHQVKSLVSSKAEAQDTEVLKQDLMKLSADMGHKYGAVARDIDAMMTAVG